MKYFLTIIISIIFAVGSIYLAAINNDYWWLFLIASIITFVYPEKNNNDDK